MSHTISLLESIYEKNFNGLNKENAVPIIFSSTCSTYGIHKNYPITEEFSQNPINPYAKSKYFVEEILKDLSNVFNIKSIILRYFNVGGASRDMLIGENRDNETHLIPLAVKTALEINDNLAIYGNDYETPDGTCIRDYVHVCDVAEAHVKAMELLYLENKKGFDPLKKRLNNCNIFNLGTGKGYSVKEIIKVTEEVTKKKLKVTFQDRRVGDPPILLASCEKFKKVFDWEPKHRNIRRIIEDSYNWEIYLLNKFHKNH